MSRKFLTALDLGKNELQNGVIQNLAGAPSSPVKGQIYMNSTDNTMYFWDGTAWVPMKSGAPTFGTIVAETTFGLALNNGVATTTARSDHTHGSPAHSAAEHASIPLSALGVPTAPINMNGQTIQNVGTPVNPTDAANKSYVDNAVAGLSWKDACRAASTVNVNIAAPGTLIDGVTPANGDRILVKNNATASQNGIYVYNGSAAAMTRATDADIEAELINAAVWISEGTTQADTAWVMTTNPPITVGTTNLTWIQFAGGGTVTAGVGLTQVGNTIDVGQGTGITVAADSVAVDTSVIATVASLANKADKATTLTAGAGLAGGGDLSANRTFDIGAGTGITVLADSIALDSAYMAANFVLPARILTAGVGLTGGGNLSADRAFDVGAGTGITVAADSVALDTAYTDARYVAVANVPKRFAQNVGGSTSQVITHNLNTRDLNIQVFRNATPWDSVECDMELTSTTTATLRFAVAPAANEYRVVIIG